MPKVLKVREPLRPILRHSTASAQLKADELKGKVQKGKVKHVRWHPETEDNDYKSKPRPKALVPVKKKATAEKVLAAQQARTPPTKNNVDRITTSSSQGRQKYRSPSPHPVSMRRRSLSKHAMTPESIPGPSRDCPSRATEGTSQQGLNVSDLVVLPSQKLRRRSKNTTLSLEEMTTDLLQPQRSIKHRADRQISTPNPIMNTTSTRDSPGITPSQRFLYGYVDMYMGTHLGNLRNSESVEVVADSKAKRVSKVVSTQQRTYRRPRALPTVPDPPVDEYSRGPPPTPRPARLSTPDLPEIIVGNYFQNLRDIGRDCNMTTSHLTRNKNADMCKDKMNAQLEDARTHMQEMTAKRK